MVMCAGAYRLSSAPSPEGTEITFDEVAGAYHRIRGDILRTSCSYSHHMSKALGMELYMKKEFQHESGSFKVCKYSI
eukprot:1364229-Amorphochlora_amoeboformis.AAC.2